MATRKSDVDLRDLMPDEGTIRREANPSRRGERLRQALERRDSAARLVSPSSPAGLAAEPSRDAPRSRVSRRALGVAALLLVASLAGMLAARGIARDAREAVHPVPDAALSASGEPATPAAPAVASSAEPSSVPSGSAPVVPSAIPSTERSGAPTTPSAKPPTKPRPAVDPNPSPELWR